MIIGIVAVDKNFAIGKINKETGKPDMLFHLPADLKFFKKTTSQSIVVMGYNTLISLPGSKPLKNRTNIVLCPEGIEPEDCIVYHDFNRLVHDLLLLSKVQDVFIIGGAMFYQSMLPYYDLVYVTKVDAIDSAATAFFPNLDTNDNFEVIDASATQQDSGYNIRFITYKRKTAGND